MAASVTTTKASLYSFLSKIQDPHTRQLLKMILDQTGNLNNQAPDIGKVTQPLDTHMDANGNKVQNLATPTASTDAANKDYVDKQIAQLVKSMAQPR